MAPWLRPWGRWGCQWKPNSWKASNSLARKLSERFKYLPNKGVQPTKIWWYNHILKSCSPRGSYIERESIHSGVLQKPRCQPAWNPTSIDLHFVMSSPAGGTLLVARYQHFTVACCSHPNAILGLITSPTFKSLLNSSPVNQVVSIDESLRVNYWHCFGLFGSLESVASRALNNLTPTQLLNTLTSFRFVSICWPQKIH